MYATHPGFVDLGLGGFLLNAGYPAWTYQPELGKVKVPTLRNVDKRPNPAFVKAFGHNGYFKSLKQIVHFYNTRDVLRMCVRRSRRGGHVLAPAGVSRQRKPGRTGQSRVNRRRGGRDR